MPATFRRASDAVWRQSHDGVLVLAAPDHDVVSLTGAAAALWQLLDVPRTVDEAARALAEAYSGAPQQIAADLDPLLADLVARGVVDRVTRP